MKSTKYSDKPLKKLDELTMDIVYVIEDYYSYLKPFRTEGIICVLDDCKINLPQFIVKQICKCNKIQKFFKDKHFLKVVYFSNEPVIVFLKHNYISCLCAEDCEECLCMYSQTICECSLKFVNNYGKYIKKCLQVVEEYESTD